MPLEIVTALYADAMPVSQWVLPLPKAQFLDSIFAEGLHHAPPKPYQTPSPMTRHRVVKKEKLCEENSRSFTQAQSLARRLAGLDRALGRGPVRLVGLYRGYGSVLCFCG
jgi:hypothetical protein